jgi:PIN domain nuclease of toxin-antitoxin system
VSENYVLDASALLCLLQDEKGAKRVAEALPDAQIGAVNFSEAFDKLVEAGLDEETVDSLIDSLQLQVIPFDRQQARLAGSLRRTTREFGLCRSAIEPALRSRASKAPSHSPATSRGRGSK